MTRSPSIPPSKPKRSGVGSWGLSGHVVAGVGPENLRGVPSEPVNPKFLQEGDVVRHHGLNGHPLCVVTGYRFDPKATHHTFTSRVCETGAHVPVFGIAVAYTVPMQDVVRGVKALRAAVRRERAKAAEDAFARLSHAQGSISGLLGDAEGRFEEACDVLEALLDAPRDPEVNARAWKFLRRVRGAV